MAFFKALFGQPKKVEPPKPTIPSPKRSVVRSAMQELEERENQITKKIDSLRKQCDALLQSAKDAMAVNPKSESQKAIAGRFLKKKKMYEKEIDSLSHAEERLMEQRIAIETQNMQVDTLSVMDKVNKVVPKLDADAAALVLDEINERVQDSEEINDVFSRPIGTEIDVSDDMAELEAELADEAAVAPPMNVPSIAEAVAAGAGGGIPLYFPAVPSTPLVAKISSPQNVKKINSFERELASLETA
jgi:charged multivesicular body protein 4